MVMLRGIIIEDGDEHTRQITGGPQVCSVFSVDTLKRCVVQKSSVMVVVVTILTDLKPLHLENISNVC